MYQVMFLLFRILGTISSGEGVFPNYNKNSRMFLAGLNPACFHVKNWAAISFITGIIGVNVFLFRHLLIFGFDSGNIYHV